MIPIRRTQTIALTTITLVLVSLGGCIPIPATGQYMINGEKIPSYSIGSDTSSPVQLGVTDINAAVEKLSYLISGPVPPTFGGQRSVVSQNEVKAGIMELKGGSAYAIPYSKVTGYVQWILLFDGLRETEDQLEFVILMIDEKGIVTGTKTMSDIRSLLPARESTPFALKPASQLTDQQRALRHM